MDAVATVQGGKLFNRKPIECGGFRLSHDGVTALGAPSIDGWAAALELASALHEKSPHWIAMLLRYAETRQDWQKQLSQAESVTGLSRHTLENLRSLGRRLTPPAWPVGPSPGHGDAVAVLNPDVQVEWRTKAKAG